MEVSGSYSDYRNEKIDNLQKRCDKVNEIVQEPDVVSKSDGFPLPQDEYISREKSGYKPSGIYSLGKDKDGNLKILYDDPKKPVKKDDNKPTTEDSPILAAPQKSKNCTTNTDKVDREIEKLKEEKKQLEQQIRAAASNETKVSELEKKLEQVVRELMLKNNDTYRSQHAVITE